MGLFQGISDFGLVSRGFNNAAQVQQDRDVTNEITQMELNRLRRQDALQQQVRQIMGQYGLGGANAMSAVSPSTVTTSTLPQSPVDDTVGLPGSGDAAPDDTNPDGTVPENQPVQQTRQTLGAPAQSNLGGAYLAAANAYEQNGDFTNAQRLRQAVQQFQNEGYAHLIQGVVQGQSPQQIQANFNPLGQQRITDGTKNDDGSYDFTFDDGSTQHYTPQTAMAVGTRMGIFKSPNTVTAAPGSTVIDKDTGQVIGTGGPQVPRYRPLSDEEALAQFKSNLAASQGVQDPAKIREVKAVADLAFKGDVNQALSFVYGMRDQPRSTQVLNLAKLYTDDGLKADQAVQKAESIVDGLRVKDTPSRGGVVPPPSPVPSPAPASQPSPSGGSPMPSAPQTLPLPGGKGSAIFTGRLNVMGKPIYKDPVSNQLFVGE